LPLLKFQPSYMLLVSHPRHSFVNAVTTDSSKLESMMFDGPQWHPSWKILWNPFS